MGRENDRQDVAGDRHARWILAGLVVAVALPILVVTVRAAVSEWQPYDVDNSTLLLRTLEVGGRRTPLVGAWSRYGWDHPGPIQFWLSAPAVRLLGPAGMLVTAGLVNLTAAGGAVLAADRVGGLGLAAPTALAVAVMTHAGTAFGVIHPWNPYVGTLPLLAYLLCAYGAANGHPGLLVGAVVAGSWCTQTHIGYLPVAAGVAILLVGWSVARRRVSRRVRPEPDPPRIPRRWLGIGALVGGILWLPPLIDLVFGQGNARKLVAFARSGHNPAQLPAEAVGWRDAGDAFGKQFGPTAPWLVGDPTDYTSTPAGTAVAVLPIIAVLGAVVLLAWRWKAPKVAGLAGLALVVMPLAYVAMARTADVLMTYVLRWTWALAALGWIALTWALATLLSERARVVLATGSCAAVLVLGVVTLNDGTADSGDMRERRALTDFSGQIEDALAIRGDDTYLLEADGNSDWFYTVFPGLALDLITSDHDVVVHDGLGRMFKDWWMPERGRTYDTVVILPNADVPRWRESHPDAELVASYAPSNEADPVLAIPHEAWLLPRDET